MNRTYYHACREHCRKTWPSLHFATTFGDSALRVAMSGTWAVVHQLRRIMLDEAEPGGCCGESTAQRVEVCGNVLDHLYSGKETGKPELDGFAALAEHHHIDQAILQRYAEGLAASREVKRFATWNRVRSDYEQTGGALAAHLISACAGVNIPEHHAVAWTASMQLAEAAMQLGDQWQRGRLCVALDDLVRAKLTERDVAAMAEQTGDPRWQDLTDHLNTRIASLYRGGVRFITYLPAPAQRVAAVFGELHMARWDAWRKTGVIKEGHRIKAVSGSLRLLRTISRDKREAAVHG